VQKIEELNLVVAEKQQNLRRLQAQRNELNAKVRMLREELQLLVRGRGQFYKMFFTPTENVGTWFSSVRA
jgi:uncharacterized coiled-coil DUF342 family protein